MLFRRLTSAMRLCSRAFSETPVNQSSSVMAKALEVDEVEDKIESKIPLSELLNLDSYNFPKTSMRNYDYQMRKVMFDYMISLREVINEGETGVFDSIEVFSFAEVVPLSKAAMIYYLGNNEYRIDVFDHANAPLLELGLIESGYNFDVKRDFSVIHVKYHPDHAADNAKLKQLEEKAIAEITKIRNDAVRECEPRNPKANIIFDSLLRKNSKVIKELANFKRKQEDK